MTKLSVNINKIATLRNARGGNVPNVVQFALDCEQYGAQGITVHPRPDERHITFKDVFDLKGKSNIYVENKVLIIKLSQIHLNGIFNAIIQSIGN